MKRLLGLVIAFALLFPSNSRAAEPNVRVGSKRFTESYVLAEIVVGLVRADGGQAEHEQGLGATAVAFEALEEGRIDALPEYTGTLAEAVLHTHDASLSALRAAMDSHGLAISDPIGFQNTFALAMTTAKANELGVKTTSDLSPHPDLRYVLS
ncbi:MAG: glycine betaine ABC transporter substrate-binding protein, partial [Polyangiaceae bacterium]